LDKVTLENRLMDNFSHELDDLKNSCYLVADLRNVFDDVKKPLFYDNVHLNDLGNQIVAKEIYEKILPIVLEDISTPFNLTIFDSTKI
jgi:lysophospholipase L1-like esterase